MRNDEGPASGDRTRSTSLVIKKALARNIGHWYNTDVNVEVKAITPRIIGHPSSKAVLALMAICLAVSWACMNKSI